VVSAEPGRKSLCTQCPLVLVLEVGRGGGAIRSGGGAIRGGEGSAGGHEAGARPLTGAAGGSRARSLGPPPRTDAGGLPFRRPGAPLSHSLPYLPPSPSLPASLPFPTYTPLQPFPLLSLPYLPSLSAPPHILSPSRPHSLSAPPSFFCLPYLPPSHPSLLLYPSLPPLLSTTSPPNSALVNDIVSFLVLFFSSSFPKPIPPVHAHIHTYIRRPAITHTHKVTSQEQTHKEMGQGGLGAYLGPVRTKAQGRGWNQSWLPT
jgi:hypothetical protein